MKDVLFLGAMYSQDCIDRYRVKSIIHLQYAAQNLQESILEGLISNAVGVKVLTKPILSTWPHGYKDYRIKECDFIFRGDVLGKSLGFLNIPFFNYPSKREYFKYIDQWHRESSIPKTIMVYSLSRHLMTIAVEAKKKYKDIELVQIVPDLPRFMGCNKYYKLLGQQKRDIKEIYRLVKLFDKYVVLSEKMVDDLGITDNPYVVMEGIFSPESGVNAVEKDEKKVILYTGNLGIRYGIIDLLDAFSLIQDANYRLWLRGNGNSEPVIRERMKNDNRIVLIPSMSKAALIELQKKATLLVNPVKPTQEFTKYFFPSKTMDYLASGTPTMMYKLDCLPKEYHDYLLFFKGDSAKEMAESIIECCSKTQEELNTIGKRAQRFIMDNKLSKQQVKKIIEL